MKEKKQKEKGKRKISNKGKGKYHEKIKVGATFQELMNMAANGNKKKSGK